MGIRVIDMPVLALEQSDALVERLVVAARQAVELDGADVLVLRCTGMLGVSAALQDALDCEGP